MKNFFQLKENLIVEKTVELAGVTLQHMEHCPGAVAAFKRNLKDGASESDVAKAAQAVDNYLAIEDKAKKAGKASDADVEEMEKRIDKARTLIDKLGLEGHTYHDMHLDRVEDMVEDDDEELEDDEDEDDDDYDDDEDEDDEDEEEEKNMKKEKKTMKESIEDMMPASPDEKSMAMRQAKFIEYVAEEIEEYLEQNRAFPEWMQNKLTALHQKAKDMHAVMAGEYNEDEMEEAKSYGPGHIGAIQRMLDKERQIKKAKGSVKKESVELEEKVWAADYNAGHEKSQFGGYRPHVTNKKTGKTMYLGQTSYKKPEHAKGHAAAYLKGYEQMGDRTASRMANEYEKANKKHVYKESVELEEKLKVSDGMGAWIDDFKKSDAPQFKGKSEKERRDMAIAAYLSAKRGQQK